MRKFYSEPVLDVTLFVADDVLAVSNTEIWDTNGTFWGEE